MDDNDIQHLRRCVELATEALDAGDEPFGSLLTGPTGPYWPRIAIVLAQATRRAIPNSNSRDGPCRICRPPTAHCRRCIPPESIARCARRRMHG
ncbi:putative cytidine/deoxycytidylate deaminase [Mycobacteroides abscessus subsp. bolletii 1513]|uniref:Putative cytidine/deoxycytidylate deaminase n=1 Tax=Mycobacteroides abscessus subsp. bolletii 1513 TaxID=1299321 RepID=X8DIN3_9MYCO|nr:putative cytidine/deoxycytidylate deaminase [Mycobacteroides abscessus subsp. bolletii 1513]